MHNPRHTRERVERQCRHSQHGAVSRLAKTVGVRLGLLFWVVMALEAEEILPDYMIPLVDDAAKMSIAVYNQDQQMMDNLREEGWELFGRPGSLPSGLDYGVWGRRLANGKKEVFVVFGGTASGADAAADLGQSLDGPESTWQYQDALALAASFVARADKDPNLTVKFAGHSLGGGLAQYVGLELGVQAITFNAAPIQWWTPKAMLQTFLRQKNRRAQRDVAANNVYNIRLRGDLVSSPPSPGRQYGRRLEFDAVKRATGQWTGDYRAHDVRVLLEAFQAVYSATGSRSGTPDVGGGAERGGVFAGIEINEADFATRRQSLPGTRDK